MELVFTAHIDERSTRHPSDAERALAGEAARAMEFMGAIFEGAMDSAWSQWITTPSTSARDVPSGIEFYSTIIAMADTLRYYDRKYWKIDVEIGRDIVRARVLVSFRARVETHIREVAREENPDGYFQAYSVPTRGTGDATTFTPKPPPRAPVIPQRRFNLGRNR